MQIVVLFCLWLLLGCGSAQAQLRAVQVAAGAAHACALESEGTVRCWGDNSYGQLGDGSTTSRTIPVTVAALGDVVALAAGHFHTCAVLTDGTARCWGNNAAGQLGDGSAQGRTVAVAVAGLSGVAALAAGERHTCALLLGGAVHCWGDNRHGQLGDGSTTPRRTPAVVADLGAAQTLTAGDQHTCAVTASGAVRCWGDNSYGQLGDGSRVARTTPVTVVGIDGAQAVAAGAGHTCARVAGAVRCWGYNFYGQLGNGSKVTLSTTPVAVVGLSDVVRLSAGLLHTCAQTASGAVSCWGNNWGGQLADGTNRKRTTPLVLAGAQDASALAAGGGHTCAVLQAAVHCWGNNYHGEVGDGSSGSSQSHPQPVAGLGQTVALATSMSSFIWWDYIHRMQSHACAVGSDGSVRCWGKNDYGQLGDGTTSYRTSPVMVNGLRRATAVVAGSAHTCVLHDDGTVSCWGSSSWGQLGDGSATDYSGQRSRSTPAPVIGLGQATALVSAGDTRTCALIRDGSMWCWGNRASTPFRQSGVNNATALAAGNSHLCALIVDGTVRCWGNNYSGQLGDGTTNWRIDPVPVTGLRNVVTLAAAGSHTCAATTDGLAYCWGSNDAGQLGNGDSSRGKSLLPQAVIGLTGVTQLAAGINHVCALLSNSTVRCWGGNAYGELGAAIPFEFFQPMPFPQVVPELSHVKTLTANAFQTCALLHNGAPLCWGSLDYTASNLGVRHFVRGYGVPSLGASGSGSIDQYTLQVTLRPTVADVGRFQQVFVALRNPNIPAGYNPWFGYDGLRWSTLTDPPAIAAGVAPANLSIPIFTNQPISLLCGMEIYVGYGMHYQDMLDNNRWQKVATLCQ